MKTNLVRMAVLGVAVVTMAVPAFAGQAQPARMITPDPSDWQYQSALETGNLPSDAGVLKEGSSSKTVVSKVEYAGVAYRVGIDTP